MGSKVHWKKLTNPDYLGSYAFQPGEEKIVTIKEVKREVIESERGKEECTVAHFAEDVKPMILNATNCKAITKVWGTPYIDDWVGRKIILKVKKVSAFGEMVDAVRVAPERPTETELICEACGKPIMPEQGMSAPVIAQATKNKYKRMLCMECAKKEVNNG